MGKKVKRIFIITLGVLLMAMGSTLFYAPYSIASGGVYGISIIINNIFPQFSISSILLIGNLILYVLGLFLLGKEFGLLTLYGTLGYSFFNMILERMNPTNEPLTSNILVSGIIGAGLLAIGLALVMHQGASTGGTDILVKVLSEYAGVSLSSGLLITDGLVVLASALFISLESALYAVITLYITSIMLDQVIAGFDHRIVMTIISKEHKKINRYINIELNRGTTLYPAMGGYSKQEFNVIVSIVQKYEYIKIKEYVEKIDTNAFVYVKNASEVLGEGFTREYEGDQARDIREKNYIE